MSKGDNRRPADVSAKEYADNWDRAFALHDSRAQQIRDAVEKVREDRRDNDRFPPSVV